MYLYHFEVEIGRGKVFVVVAANDEEQAFNQVDIEVESRFLQLPQITNVVLREKKIIRAAAGFVITSQ